MCALCSSFSHRLNFMNRMNAVLAATRAQSKYVSRTAIRMDKMFTDVSATYRDYLSARPFGRECDGGVSAGVLRCVFRYGCKCSLSARFYADLVFLFRSLSIRRLLLAALKAFCIVL